MVSRRAVLGGTVGLGAGLAGFGFLHYSATDTAVDAREFGAKGDGETDDTAALQEALDQAAGSRLVIPSGRYLTDRLWTRPATHITLQPGAALKFLPQVRSDRHWGGILNVHGTPDEPIAGVIIDGGGTIDGSGGTHTLTNLNLEALDLDHAADCTISGITVVNAEADGIDIDSCTNCTVEDVLVRDAGGFGVHISTGNRNVTVRRVTAIDCGHTYERGGFDTHPDQTSDCTYVDCVAVRCYRGFWIRAPRSTLTNCESVESLGNGVRCTSGNSTRITGFTATASGSHGIVIEGNANRVTVEQSSITDPVEDGVLIMSGAYGTVVTGCEVRRAGRHALYTLGDHGVIRDNVLESHQEPLRDEGTGNEISVNVT